MMAVLSVTWLYSERTRSKKVITNEMNHNF